MRSSLLAAWWAYTQTREAGAIMRIAGVVVVTEIALALVPSGFGADAVAWGPTVNGLRLGAAFGSDPSKPTLRVLLHNVGSEFQEVVIGHEAGGSVYDSLKFVATAPDENKREGFHRSVFTPIAGLVLPFSLRLTAGATHELEFLLKDIIYASRTTTTLDALVKEGYSIRVRFEANQRDADWARLSHAWVGSVSSAEILPPH